MGGKANEDMVKMGMVGEQAHRLAGEGDNNRATHSSLATHWHD